MQILRIWVSTLIINCSVINVLPNFVFVDGSLITKKKGKIQKLSDFPKNGEDSVAEDYKAFQSTLKMTSETAIDHVFIGRQYFSEEVLTTSVGKIRNTK